MIGGDFVRHVADCKTALISIRQNDDRDFFVVEARKSSSEAKASAAAVSDAFVTAKGRQSKSQSVRRDNLSAVQPCVRPHVRASRS